MYCNPTSSTIVLAETGVDMIIFDDAKHLCSWCGLSPANNESAGKKKSVRIAKAGDYLKPMMVQNDDGLHLLYGFRKETVLPY